MTPIPRPATTAMQPNPAGTNLARFLVCSLLSDGNPEFAAKIAAEHCRTSPAVQYLFSHRIREQSPGRFVTRAESGEGDAPLPPPAQPVSAGATSVIGWAQELAAYGIAREAFLLLQSASIFGRLTPAFRRLPFRVRLAKEVGAGMSGVWRGEGLPHPIMQSMTNSFQSEFYEIDCSLVCTQEILRFGNVAEQTLKNMVINGVAKFIDLQLLDPSVALTANHPASLTHGAVAIVSSGSTAANIIADLSALIAALQTPGDELRWIMRPLTYATICAKLAGAGYATPPGFLLNIPVITGSTSPPQITLLDCSAIAYSSDDLLLVDATRQAAIEMSTAPAQTTLPGVGVNPLIELAPTVVSMFQTNSAAIRALAAVAWQHIYFDAVVPTQPSGCSYMVVNY